MSTNCLITKLKGEVNNDSLNIFGELRITFTPSSSGTVFSINTSQYSAYIVNAETTFTIVGNGSFKKGSDTSVDLGKTVTLNAYNGSSANGVVLNSADASELVLIINSLYNLSTSISSSSDTDGFPGTNYVSNIKGLESLKYLNFTKIKCEYCSMEVSLEDALMGNVCKTFYWRRTDKLSGDIAIFGNNPNLTQINCLDNTNIYGSIESIVEGLASKGFADGSSVTMIFNGNQKISFHDIKGTSSIPYAGTMVMTRSGSNYIVTQGGITKGTYTPGSGWVYA